MTVDPEDDKVRAAFASLKAESSAHFPPPPVNELIMRGPAALRRRKLVSLAAIVGACTAVTAGGFAVAQTLGPLAGGPESSDDGNTAVATSPSGETPSFNIGDPASPESDEHESPTDQASVPAETTLVITDSGGFRDECAAGTFGLGEDWTFTDDTAWEIAFDAETGVGPVLGDVNGDGAEDVTVVLECRIGAGDIVYYAGVAAFSWNEDGTSLEQLGWVWKPHSIEGTVALVSVEEGVVTVESDDINSPDHTGEFRYVWDPETEAFTKVEDDATTEPEPDESSSSPTPAETPTTEETTATDSGGS